MTATHTFRGRNMQDAVASLKARLGPDAVIVRTHRGQDQTGQYVEITATGRTLAPAPEPVEPPAMGGALGASAAYQRAAARDTDGPFAERAAYIARKLAADRAQASVPPAPAPIVDVDRRVANEDEAAPITAVMAELSSLRAAVDALVKRSDSAGAGGVDAEAVNRAMGTLADQLREIRGLLASSDARGAVGKAELATVLRERLVDVGVCAPHAESLAQIAHRHLPDRTPEDRDTLALVGRLLADGLSCAGDLADGAARRRVLAFVGPTGVGKTTTIAKVAARARLLKGVPTALVTVDTFRLAAVEQLARYAEIMECPLRVVKQPDALPQVLDELSDYPLVLVDSTGRSPRAEDQVNALARFFPSGWGGELVLTLACSTRERDLFAAIDAFGALDYDYLCVTKTDETDALGTVYSLARRGGRPLTWLTNGQRVPEDIAVAEPTSVAARIVARTADRHVDSPRRAPRRAQAGR